MDLRLSVLDHSPVSSGSTGAKALRNTLEVARLADRLGYERYWLAEHHKLPSVDSSAPEVMIGHVASATKVARKHRQPERPEERVLDPMEERALGAGGSIFFRRA